MPDKIDMSLDDIIKTNRGGRTAGRGGGMRGARGGRGIGARFNAGRPGSRSLNRKPVAAGGTGGVNKRRSGSGGLALKKQMRSPDGKWLHDLYGGQGGSLTRGAATGRLTSSSGGPGKITISNLDFGVNDKDIQDLFEEFGAIRKAAVHYDRTGRSLGTADVVFEKKQDAIRAVKKYNGVQLDGREMNIQITESVTTIATRPIASAAANTSYSPRRRGGLIARGIRRGGRGMTRGRGGARRGANKPTKTAAELDADLDTYTSKMQTD